MKARVPRNAGGAAANNMQGMIRQAQKMQDEMKIKQDEIEAMEFTTEAGGGMVTCVMNGKKEIVSLTLKKEAVDPEDVEILQDAIKAAVNEAIKKIEDVTTEEMTKITGGISIPGLF